MATRSPFCTPRPFRTLAKRWTSRVQVGVGDRPGVAGLAFPVVRDLVAVPGGDVAVDGVVADVELAADEPLGEGQLPVADRVPLLEPVEELRGLPGPEALVVLVRPRRRGRCRRRGSRSLKSSGGGNVRSSWEELLDGGAAGHCRSCGGPYIRAHGPRPCRPPRRARRRRHPRSARAAQRHARSISPSSSASTLEAVGDDNACRVVVLTGAGRAFCSGLDLKDYGVVPGHRRAPGRPDRPALDARVLAARPDAARACASR